MQNISATESDNISRCHLEGIAIWVTAHAPQKGGKCHPFDFLRAAIGSESAAQAFERVRPDILQHIENETGKSCTCRKGNWNISYRTYGGW